MGSPMVGIRALWAEKPVVRTRKCRDLLAGLDGYSKNSTIDMATITSTDSYDSSHKNRGVALVIVNEDFDPPREGANDDEMNMTSLFENLQFKVTTKSNLTADDVTTLLDEVLGRDDFHRNSDCFVFIISTHGREIQLDDGTHLQRLYCMENTFITTQTIVNKVNECDALKGKPKLFFIQACRFIKDRLGRDPGHDYVVKNGNFEDEAKADHLGHTRDLGSEEETEIVRHELEQNLNVQSRQYDDADPAEGPDSIPETKDDVYIPKVCLPKDTLIMYAIPSGYYARRQFDYGSVMLNKLKEVLEKIPEDRSSLLTALTNVAGKVAEEYEYEYNETTYKVVPQIHHRLRYDLYFTKKQTKI
ncbi:hypothetical protein CHS0354_033123 [Potamilus streckersoni]|uniref:Caspase family p20 domain-containing protein n=1 Tax=Potamilus streckersoni TaxID=2493646 RepID=A0AAE0VQ94_9BIVA|nr:hypothetical protein CHS0354_033123 [Potamilus streckersoni]